MSWQQENSRRFLIIVFLSSAIVFLGFPLIAWCGTHPRYNVVLIVGDAVRPDYLECYGGDAKTPNLNKLKDSGVIFTRAYSAAPWTSPSSVSIMTGKYADSYKTEPFHETTKVLVPNSELLLLEVLRKAGYENRYNIENWNARIHNQLQGAEALSPDINQARLVLKREEIERESGIYSEVSYDKTYSFLDFLLTVDSAQPFFALKWFMDPHAPYNPNSKFRNRIRLDGNPLPLEDHYADLTQKRHVTEQNHHQVSVNKVLYKASIESVDERVGFILSALKFRGLLDKTFVIFISDHGELFGEHGLFEHGGFGKNCTFFEPLLRVPFIISGPTIPKGKVISDPVSLLDLMPTLKALLSVDYPDTMQGENLVNLINGKEKPRGELYFSNIIENEQQDAVLQGGNKLIVRRDGGMSLFNLETDPDEENDVSGTDGNLTKKLLSLLKNHRQENLRREKGMPDDLKGFVPKSKSEEREIIHQLKSLGYIR